MPLSDEVALEKTKIAAKRLTEALANVYPGDPVHHHISHALMRTNDAIAYMKRLRDNL